MVLPLPGRPTSSSTRVEEGDAAVVAVAAAATAVSDDETAASGGEVAVVAMRGGGGGGRARRWVRGRRAGRAVGAKGTRCRKRVEGGDWNVGGGQNAAGVIA